MTITYNGKKGETTGRTYYLSDYTPMCLVAIEGQYWWISKKLLVFIK